MFFLQAQKQRFVRLLGKGLEGGVRLNTGLAEADAVFTSSSIYSSVFSPFLGFL